MPLTPVELPHLRGLDLQGDAQEADMGAIDLKNVVFSPSVGRIVTRPGTVTVPSSQVFNYIAPHLTNTVLAQQQGASPVTLRAFLNDVSVATASSPGTLSGYANYGTPSATTTYLAMGPAAQFVKYAATAFANVPAIQNWSAAAVWPTDSRLFVANHVADVSRVGFSDQGAPETFGASSYVSLTPGDGQRVVAMATYQNQVFAFKSTKFFVFYGMDTGPGGVAEPGYRTVDTGIGVVDASPGYIHVAVGPDGVYFVGRDGVYVTNGGPPRLVLPLTALSRAGQVPYFTGTTSISYPFALAYYDDRLYLSMSNASHAPAQTFVYDLRTQDLSLFTIKAYSFALVPSTFGMRPSLYFAVSDPVTDGDIRKFSEATNLDSGAFTIACSYRTGFFNLGKPGAVATVREWLIDGTGTVTVKTAVDDKIALGSGAPVTLGTAPQVAQGRDRRAVRGRNVSLELSGIAPWSVSRVIGMVRGQASPGLKPS